MFTPPIKIITQKDFDNLIKDGRVYVIENGVPTVVRTASGAHFVKAWHRKQGFTSDRIRPYVHRFYSNALLLNKRGISAPIIEKYHVVMPSKLQLLVYKNIPGETVERLEMAGQEWPVFALGEFFAKLHANGVYFRNSHLGNIIYMGSNDFALIDVTDVRFKPRALSLKLRIKNLKYAWLEHRLSRIFRAEKYSVILNAYILKSGLNGNDGARLRASLEQAWLEDVRRKQRE